MDLEICLAGAFVAICVVCLTAWIAHEVRKGPRNRRTGLPAPSDACRRTPDWSTSEPRSPRGYVP